MAILGAAQKILNKNPSLVTPHFKGLDKRKTRGFSLNPTQNGGLFIYQKLFIYSHNNNNNNNDTSKNVLAWSIITTNQRFSITDQTSGLNLLQLVRVSFAEFICLWGFPWLCCLPAMLDMIEIETSGFLCYSSSS